MAQVAADLRGPWFRVELRSSWATALLYRAPSVPVVWALVRLGVSPLAVSLIGLLLALSMPLQALNLPVGIAAVTVALSGMMFQVLDCADGILARVTDRTSKLGGDVDTLIDLTQWGLLYLSVGLLADATLDTGLFWTASAAVAAWARLLARVIRDRLDDGIEATPRPLRLAQYPSAFIAGISGLIPLLALTGPWMGTAVCALVVYSLLDVAEALVPLVRALRE